MEKITSLQNSKVKEVVSLSGSSERRRERGLFVVEGRREIERCLTGGFRISALFYCPEIISPDALPFAGEALLYEVSESVYDKMAYRGGTEGVVALAEDSRPRGLDDIVIGTDPLIVVLESVEKPGNLGAVLRSADAVGVDAVIICDPRTDLYNPNLIRSSLGGVFTSQIAVADSADAVGWLKKRGIKIFTAQLQDSSLYYDADMTGALAIVMGSESTGLSEMWREVSDRKIFIPMLGVMDSLNVSVSMAVLCYEALRQRQEKYL